MAAPPAYAMSASVVHISSDMIGGTRSLGRKKSAAAHDDKLNRPWTSALSSGPAPSVSPLPHGRSRDNGDGCPRQFAELLNLDPIQADLHLCRTPWPQAAAQAGGKAT